MSLDAALHNNPRDIEPRLTPMPEEAVQAITKTVFRVQCNECGIYLYIFDDGKCPWCGQDCFEDLGQYDVEIELNQYTGEVEVTAC